MLKKLSWLLDVECYSLDKFEEGAEQFRIDIAQNPNDTEESIWCFLCEAQLYGVDEARKRFLEVGTDPRPVMREAYNMFKDGGDPEKFYMINVFETYQLSRTGGFMKLLWNFPLISNFSNGRDNEYFYASLYAGLYYESKNEMDEAKFHILAASASPYGQRSDDYMASLAKTSQPTKVKYFSVASILLSTPFNIANCRRRHQLLPLRRRSNSSSATRRRQLHRKAKSGTRQRWNPLLQEVLPSLIEAKYKAGGWSRKIF